MKVRVAEGVGPNVQHLAHDVFASLCIASGAAGVAAAQVRDTTRSIVEPRSTSSRLPRAWFCRGPRRRPFNKRTTLSDAPE